MLLWLISPRSLAISARKNKSKIFFLSQFTPHPEQPSSIQGRNGNWLGSDIGGKIFPCQTIHESMNEWMEKIHRRPQAASGQHSIGSYWRRPSEWLTEGILCFCFDCFFPHSSSTARLISWWEWNLTPLWVWPSIPITNKNGSKASSIWEVSVVSRDASCI